MIRSAEQLTEADVAEARADLVERLRAEELQESDDNGQIRVREPKDVDLERQESEIELDEEVEVEPIGFELMRNRMDKVADDKRAVENKAGIAAKIN